MFPTSRETGCKSNCPYQLLCCPVADVVIVVDLVRIHDDVLVGVAVFRQPSPQAVTDDRLHSVLRLVLLGPTDHLREALLDGVVELDRHSLDRLYVGPGEILLEQQLEHGHLLLAGEALADILLLLLVQLLGKPHELDEGPLDGGLVLLGVVFVDNFLVTFVEVRAKRVFLHCPGHTLLQHGGEVVEQELFALHTGELSPQLVEVDLADVELGTRLLVLAGRGDADTVVDDSLQGHHLLDGVGHVDLLRQLVVDGPDGVALAPELLSDLLNVGELEHLEDLAGEDAEALPVLQRSGDGVGSVLDLFQLREALSLDQRLQLEAAGAKMLLFLPDELRDAGEQLLLVDHRLVLAGAVGGVGVIRKGLAHRLHDADVVDDEPVALALAHAVGAGYRLHEGMGLHRLVEIHGAKRLHVEAGEPHGAHEHDAQGICLVLELVVQLALDHLLSMRGDVQAPGVEAGDLVLLLAHHDRHLGFFHPGDLSPKLQRLLLVELGQPSLLGRDGLRPILLDQVVHHHAGDLVHADEHCLSGFPYRAVMAHEVLGDCLQAWPGHEDVDVAAQIALELLGLVLVEVHLLQCVQQLVVDVGIVDLQQVASVLVVQGHGRSVLDRAFEVVDGQVPAEGPLRQVVVLQKRRSGEADSRRRGQDAVHVVGVDAVVGAMGLVGQDDDVVVGDDGLDVCVVELVDKGEDEARVAPQLLDQVLAAGSDVTLRSHTPQAAAALERVADLGVQLVSVRKDEERGRLRRRPPLDLSGDEHHGVALAAALRVPEHTQLAAVDSALLEGFDGLVGPQELVVAGDDLRRGGGEMVEEDEVLEQVHEIPLRTDPAQHGGEPDRPGLISLVQSLPFVKELVGAPERADLRLEPVGEDNEGVVVEDLRDGALVVGKVVLVSAAHVLVVAFELHEHQRDSVHEADDIASPGVEGRLHDELLAREEAVHFRMFEVENPGSLLVRRAVGANALHRNAVAEHIVFLLVRLQQRVGRQRALEGRYDAGDLVLLQPFVQLEQSRRQIAFENDMLVVDATERAVLAQLLLVVAVDDVPAELAAKQLAGGFLDGLLL